MKKEITILLICLLLLSCVEEKKWNLTYKSSADIAVEATFTNELKHHIVKISKPVYELNGKPDPITGAAVTISFNNKVLNCIESANSPGSYESPIFKAGSDTIYYLKIEFAGKSYTASASAIPVSSSNPVGYYYDEEKSLYTLQEDFGSAEPAMFEITIDWRKTNSPYVIGDTGKQAKAYYYVLKTVDLDQLDAKHEKIYFPKGSEITQRKYSLSIPHAMYIRSLINETRMRGGYFDDYPSNVRTNLSDGATGFFGVCEVTTVWEPIK